MEKVMEKIKNTRILAAVGLVSSLLGIIFPYITVTLFGTYSLKLIGYLEGKIMLVLTLANFLFIFKDYAKKYVPQAFNSAMGKAIENANPKFSLIPTVLVVVLALYLTNGTDIDFGNDYIKYGLGFWTLWLGAICLVAHAFLYKGDAVERNLAKEESKSYTTIEPQPEVVQTVDNNVKFCTGCGNKCNVADTKCPACGKEF